MPLAGAPFISLCRHAPSTCRVCLGGGHEGDHHCGPQFTDCVRMVHFGRNVLSGVPASEMSEVAEDLKAVFKVRREKTARTLAEEFVELYAKRVSRKPSRSSRRV